jgi:hypothetical protein
MRRKRWIDSEMLMMNTARQRANLPAADRICQKSCGIWALLALFFPAETGSFFGGSPNRHFLTLVLAQKSGADHKEHGVHLSGPRLGQLGPSAQADRKSARADNAARNGIESPFGIGKRRYGLGRIMAKLRCTAKSVIAMQLPLLNLDCRVRFLWRLLLFRFWHLSDRSLGFIASVSCVELG